jgi:type IV secretion/conjugal transfer VirB4 family ATPase
MLFDEHRPQSERLTDFLPWVGPIGPGQGIIWNKNDTLQKTYAFRGPDHASADMPDLVRLSGRLNTALMRGDGHWAFFIDTQRLKAEEYPTSDWPDPASWVVDCERRRGFFNRARGGLFESHYFITFVWELPSKTSKWFARFFFEDADGKKASPGVERDVEFFMRAVEELADLMAAEGGVKELIELTDEQTQTYLHSTISRNRHAVHPSQGGLLLDAYLPDQALTVGEIPMLGDFYMPTAVVSEFPASTYPGVLAAIDELGFEYRIVTRWVRMTKDEATKELEGYERGYIAKRIGFKKMLKERATGEPSVLVNNAAVDKSQEATAALRLLGADVIAYGKATTTITVWDEDYQTALDKMRAAKRVFEHQGFTVRDETINSLEAWLGSLPGKLNANVRQYNISSISLAHMMPGATAVWSGDDYNEHIFSLTGQTQSQLYCVTDDTTPFRFNTAVGDLGHTLLVGKPGAGKSFKMVTLALQHRRFHGARVVIFDKDRSARAATMAVGGKYYEPGREDSPVAFQPLARIDEPAERIWAAQFILTLLAAQGYSATSAHKETIDHTLAIMAAKPPRQRRLCHFVDQLGNQELAQVLRPYTIAGNYGQIFDADHEDIENTDWVMIEMGHLMQLGEAVIVPALAYLFHRIEAAFTGALTLLLLDEAWLFLEHPVFQARLRSWLKTLRKANVYVVFATQEVADFVNSPLMPTVLAACDTRIILPDPQASVPGIVEGYRKLKLNDTQIALIQHSEKKKHYLYMSPKGCRRYSLNPGPAQLAFAMSNARDQEVLDNIEATVPRQHWAEAILRHAGPSAAWAADQVAAAVASGASTFTSVLPEELDKQSWRRGDRLEQEDDIWTNAA